MTPRNLPKLEPIVKQEYYETSHKQRHDWKFAHTRQGEEFLFKIKILRKIRNLDQRVFNLVFEYIIKCNESLRTNFVLVNGRLMQKINKWDPEKYFVHYVDLYNKNDSYMLYNLIEKEEFRMIDYATEPLITIYVYRVSMSGYSMVLFIEHIISDWLSTEILINEIKNLYKNILAGNNKNILIKPKKIQLKDYVAWKNNLVNRKANINYWLLKDQNSNFAFNFHNFYGIYGSVNWMKKAQMKGKYTFYIDENLKSKLSLIATTCKISFPIFLIGTFIIFLSKIFKQKDILVSILWMGREKRELNDLIGNCTDFVFLFITLNSFISITEMIRLINFNFLTSCKYVYPWSNDGQWPFQDKILFKINYLPNKGKKLPLKNFDSIHKQIKSKGITSNSYLEFLERSNGIEVLCKYSLCFYSTDMIEFLFSKYLTFLVELTKAPNTFVGELGY